MGCSVERMRVASKRESFPMKVKLVFRNKPISLRGRSILFPATRSPRQYIFSILHMPLVNLNNRRDRSCLFIIDLDKIPEVLLLPVQSEQERYGYGEYWFLSLFLCVYFMPGKLLIIIKGVTAPQFALLRLIFVSGASKCLHCLISFPSVFTSRSSHLSEGSFIFAKCK